MTRADVEPAAEAIVRGDWGDRRQFLDFVVGRPRFHGFVAEVDGRIVGTGLGTDNGLVGWVGIVFVSPDTRGCGLGRALTEAAIEALERAGCQTLLLVATALGRPLYEKLGFELQGTYLTYRAPDPPPDEPDPSIRALTTADAAAVAAIDAAATGEDRAHLISSIVHDESTGFGLVADDGTLLGHILRPSWGSGSTLAAEGAVGLRLLDHRRRLAGADHNVTCGILDLNEEGRRLLEASGWTHTRSHPRLIRGRPLDWRPDSIWGQFNFALG